MSIFVKIRKQLGVVLFSLMLGIFPYTLCGKYSTMAAPLPNEGLIKSSKAITGMQYIGMTSDDRVQFLVDYWVGFDHYQEIWTSPCTTCPDYSSWLRNVKGLLGDLQSLGFVDPGTTIEGIIRSNDKSFFGPGYPSEKWWAVLNKVLRPGQTPLPWPGSSGVKNPVTGIDPTLNPGNGNGSGSTGNGTGSTGNGSGSNGNGSGSTGDGAIDNINGSEDNGRDAFDDVNKDNSKRQLKNIAEMYAYSLLGEFIGHVSVGLYEEFTTKDPEKLLENWNKHACVLRFNVLKDKSSYKLYKRITKVQKSVTDTILSDDKSSKYIKTLLISFMNVYMSSLRDFAERSGNNKGKVIEEMSTYVANSICQWVDNLDIAEANKKLKIERNKLLVSLKEKIKYIMVSLVKGYVGSERIRLTYKSGIEKVNRVVENRINEMISVINDSNVGARLNLQNFIVRVSKVVTKSFTKVSIVAGASIAAKFIVNPAKFFRELKAARGISDINPKLGHVAVHQGLFHFGSVVGTSGTVGVIAGMTGQLWLVAIPVCANVIIDYMVSKTNAATMMKKFLAEIDGSGVYTHEQQKILREYLKIASNKLNTVKNRIASIGIKKEVLGKMVTQLFNLLEGCDLTCIDDNGWRNFKETGIVAKEFMKTIVPAKIYSSYYITNAFIEATDEIYLATKAEINTSKDYNGKDARDIKQQHKVTYLKEFFKIISDMYHYMRYAGIIDLYYDKNYTKNNEKTKFFSNIKRIFNRSTNNSVSKDDISYFLKSLYEFATQKKNKDDKSENDKNHSMILADLEQKSKEFGGRMLFRNLVNTFSLLCDYMPKNKYQKIMNIIPYIKEGDIKKYTQESYDMLDKKEKNLRVFLERDARLRLSRVKPKIFKKKSTGKVTKVIL